MRVRVAGSRSPPNDILWLPRCSGLFAATPMMGLAEMRAVNAQ